MGLTVLVIGVIGNAVPVVVESGIEVPVVGRVGTVITGGTIGKGIIGGNILMKDTGAVVVKRYGNIMLGGTTNDGSGRNRKHIGGCESTGALKIRIFI